MKLRRNLIWPLWVLLLSACPAESPDNTATNNAATNNATNNAATNNTTSTGSNNTTPAVDATGRLELVPVEWGLFAGPASGGSAVDLDLADDGTVTATIEVGPGAYALRLSEDSTTVLDVTGTTADRLVPVSGDVSSQPFFVPETMTIEFDISGGAAWRVEARVVDAGVDLATDAVEPLTEAGAWFDEAFAAIVGAADPGAATVELMDEIRERGGPITTSQGVLFIAPAQDGEQAPQIRGTWNNFEAAEASELHRITPGLWARFIAVPAGEQQYKIYYPSGDAWVTDVSNPHIRWDGLVPPFGEVGDFNSVISPSGARTVWLRGLESPQLQNERDVYVHLPATYDGAMDSYPVLYVQDGNESMTRAPIDVVADQTAATTPTTRAVLVFVALPNQNLRFDEYTMASPGARGDEYVNFLADTLVPLVDGSFRTRTGREARGVYGASLGGLISFWTAMQRPALFGFAAAMSGSFFWPLDADDQPQYYLIDEIGVRGCQDIVYYIDVGTAEPLISTVPLMRDMLMSEGCNHRYLADPDGLHDWTDWRDRFGGVLTDFAAVHGG